MTQEILSDLYNACEASTAASTEFYLDTTSARGNSKMLSDMVRSHLRLQANKGYLCLLFSGHMGCGKSSELERVKTDLLNIADERSRYLAIRIDTNDYLNPAKISVPEVFIGIVSELANAVQEHLGRNILASQDNQMSIEVLRKIPFLNTPGPLVPAQFRDRVRSLPKEPDQQEQIRALLEQRMIPLLSQLNQLFAQVRSALQGKYRDIVLILDNLEKMDRVSELFLTKQPQLGGLEAHVIYTIPLHLARSSAATLSSLYHHDSPCVLPMVKVRNRKGERYEDGYACLSELIQKRIPQVPLRDVFEPDVLDYLIQYTGGNIRQLVMAIQNTCTYNDPDKTLSMISARRAIGRHTEHYSTSIKDGYWAKLVALDKSDEQRYPVGDDDYLQMMGDLTILEYVNGIGYEDEFTSPEPWYAVHPVVRRMPRFQRLSGLGARTSSS